jgi:AraC family transcriptional regulator
VLRNDKLVPLIPARRDAAPPREQPWRHILLERHTVGDIEIPEHEHREFCMHLQFEGDTELEWWTEGRNGIEHTTPGSLILLAAGTRDRLRWQGTSRRLVLSVGSEAFHRALGEERSVPVLEFVNRWSLRDAALQNIVAEMGREASEGWPLNSLYADLLGLRLSTLLIRRYAAVSVPIPALKGGLTGIKLRRAMEYLTENLHRDVRLDEVAEELGLSSFHFARFFRGSLGQSPYQYLQDQRIARAKQLLKSSALSVEAIAASTGWSSPVNFVRTFRQRVGQPPGAWRRDR